MSEAIPGINTRLPSSRELRMDDLTRRLRSSEAQSQPSIPSEDGKASRPPVFTDEIRRLFPGIDEGKIPSDRFQRERMPDPKTLTGEKKRLYDTALEFQSLFINMMLKGMRQTLHTEDDMLYGGRTQEIFEDMLYDEYSKTYSRTAGFPLAEQVYLQMAPRIQEGAAQSYEENLRNAPSSVSTDQIQREWKR